MSEASPREPRLAHMAGLDETDRRLIELLRADGRMAFRALADVIVREAVPPVEMAGCSARILDAAVAALDARHAAEATAAD